MKNRICVLMALLVAMVPHALVAAEGESLPLPGDYFNLWLWVVLGAIGVIGFVVALVLLLAPVKRGKYERIQKKSSQTR